MNRVVFIFLSILLIVFPLTIENFENENINYLELVKNIKTELIHTVVKAQVKNPDEISLTNDQAALLKIKLDELEVADLEFQNNLIKKVLTSENSKSVETPTFLPTLIPFISSGSLI